MYVKKVITIFAIALIAIPSLQAMTIPGRWEKVAAEKPGSKIIVTLLTGDRMECAFAGLATDSLIVTTLDGRKREYSKANVARITTADKRQDSLANGTAIGALVAGIPTGILALACVGTNACTGKQAGATFALWTGIGAGIGLAVDAGVKDYETLYEASNLRY